MGMKHAPVIRRLFLFVALLAVAIGPMSIGLASSAMALPGPAAIGGMSSVMPGMQMAEGMPCCPQQHPLKPDCVKGCPLALVCTTSIFAHAPDGHGGTFAISWLSHRYELMPASQLTSSPVEPPARPPKA